jgi:hypothetical protein
MKHSVPKEWVMSTESGIDDQLFERLKRVPLLCLNEEPCTKEQLYEDLKAAGLVVRVDDKDQVWFDLLDREKALSRLPLPATNGS